MLDNVYVIHILTSLYQLSGQLRISLFTPMFPSVFLLLVFGNQDFVCISHLTHACHMSSRLILLDLIILIPDEVYNFSQFDPLNPTNN
jgi:hypothetical protein